MSRAMSRGVRTVAVAAALAVLALVLSACGGGVTASSFTVTPTTTRGATLSTEESPAGRVLATPSGFTLYDFAPDTPTTSRCTTTLCVKLWPPLITTSKPTVGRGLTSTLVGTVRRPGGQLQVTYDGHPLYTYLGDRRPGMITGQALLNVGGYWYVIARTGKQVTTQFRITTSALREPSGSRR